MPQEYYILPVGSGGEIDNTLPGGGNYPSQGLPGGSGVRPSHPIVLPPLPGVWPPPGQPSLPIVLPPEGGAGSPSHPIYIEGSPEHPIAEPPGHIWPPLPPSVPPGKKALLVKVIGEPGVHWLVVDVAQPK